MITGGAGFIGSHLVEAYLTAGYQVAVVDNLSTGHRSNISSAAVKLYEIDILDFDQLKTVLADFKPTDISHHAAQVSVRRSIEDPAFDARTNVIGTINLLRLAKEFGVGHFIFASSGGAIYGESPDHQSRAERDTTKPLSPYALSKLAAEHYIDYYNYHLGLPTVALRYGNVYGPRQDPAGEAGVITLFLDRFRQNQPTTIYGTGEQVRDFIFVEDIVRANLAASKQTATGRYNIGAGQLTSINQLYQMMAAEWHSQTGQRVALPAYGQAIAGEVFWSALAIKLADDELDWRPTVKLEQGLKKTIEWFESFREK